MQYPKKGCRLIRLENTSIYKYKIRDRKYTIQNIKKYNYNCKILLSDLRIFQNVKVTETNSATGSDEIDVQVSEHDIPMMWIKHKHR